MPYRNGTYVAFHAGGTTDQTASDIRYYRTLQMWNANENVDFSFTDSHEKTAAVRDSSLRETLRARLQERLRNSKNLLLIITDTTRNDTDWVPFEIAEAVDRYKLPLIAAYPDFCPIFAPSALSLYWPVALAQRIQRDSAKVIHIPFRQLAVFDAIRQFDVTHQPPHGFWHYNYETQRRWGYVT